jgi:hypothetical protein
MANIIKVKGSILVQKKVKGSICIVNKLKDQFVILIS